MNPTTKRTLLQRFHANTTPADNDKGCIFWTGTRRPDGYGTLSVGGKTHRAHRWIYEQTHGAIGALVVLHGCDEPSCVNIEHLSVGTHADNVADARGKGRQAWQKQTHCKHGHELTDENTYITPRGHRECCACRTARYEARLPTRRKGPPMPQRGRRRCELPVARMVRW